MRFAKKFFTFMSLTGALLIFVNMDRPDLSQNPEAIELNQVAIDEFDFAEPELQNQQKKNIKIKHEMTYNPDTDLYYYRSKKYVLIDGQFYEYNPNNTYTINGVRVYFKPNPRQKKSVAKANETESMLNSINRSKLNAYSSQNIKKMFNTLRRAKKQNSDNQKALNELLSSD